MQSWCSIPRPGPAPIGVPLISRCRRGARYACWIPKVLKCRCNLARRAPWMPKTRVVNVGFVARDVPGIGHRTFYLVPTPLAPKPEQRPDLLIENESLGVHVDRGSGDVERIIEKETGEPLLTRSWQPRGQFARAGSQARHPDGLWNRRHAGTPQRSRNFARQSPRRCRKSPFARHF